MNGLRAPVRVAAIAVVALSVAGGRAAPTPLAEREPPPVERALAAYARAQQESAPDARTAAFLTAARLFDQAGAIVGNADLYANAGTAYVQAGQHAAATLAFRRALAAAPRHARARATLNELRSILPAWVPRPGAPDDDSLLGWHHRMTIAERHGIALAGALLFALALSAALVARAPWLAWLALLPLATGVAAGGSAAWQRWGAEPGDAVVTVTETQARTADSANAPPRFAAPLPGGTEVTVVETRPRWLRVRLADGRDAWVRRGALTLVDPGP